MAARSASLAALRLACGLGVAVLAAGLASAEEIRLRSGTRYDATDVSLRPGAAPGTGRVRFSFVIGAGRGTVELPYERIEPVSLFGLALARTAPDDAEGQLALADLARGLGLFTQAEQRYRRAADLDATRGPARDAGLLALVLSKAETALAAAEAEIKRGRSDVAIVRTREVLASLPSDDPAAGPLRERAQSLHSLAASVADRDLERRAAEDAARTVAAAQAASAALAAATTRAEAALASAVADRGRVADPNTAAPTAQRLLEGAEARLREARRQLDVALRVAPPPARADLEARDRDVLALLVATQLDLAELHRQGRRFGRARDFLRAAQVLDPENPRIREIHERIEQDLRQPPPDAEPVYRYRVPGVLWRGPIAPWPDGWTSTWYRFRFYR